MIEVTTHENNRFVVILDDEAMTILMAIVAGANRTEIQNVAELIRYELDYMVEKFHEVYKEPVNDGNASTS